MSRRWRWDQGRLQYFHFDNLRQIAETLVKFEGVRLDTQEVDPLRARLEEDTGLPFHPSRYKVWRNYARIFKWALIASRINGRLVVTDAGRKLAESRQSDAGWDADQYFSFLIPRIYYPSPATQEYDAMTEQVFPVCVVLRYLVANFLQNGQAAIGLDAVFSRLVGNQLQGIEPLSSYLALSDTNRRPRGDERRQVREMLIFVSQSSFLKWYNDTLYLDVVTSDLETIERIQDVATPLVQPRQANAELEVVRLGTVEEGKVMPVAFVIREAPSDIVFTEGRRVRTTHLRIERSPKLRQWFFEQVSPPYHCDMCGEDVNRRYPWVDNLLEIHHLLPLSSAVKVGNQGTTFDDLAPLCPSCHKSTHAFYRGWLRDRSWEDFPDEQNARAAFEDAKRRVVL